MDTATSVTSTNGAAPAASATTWRVDPAHSTVQFEIRKRLMFVRHLEVVGRFADVSGTLDLDEADPARSRFSLSVRPSGAITGTPRRDKHLLTKDFFDVERFPELTFTSGAIEPVDVANGHYRANGILTIRSVARPITVDVTYQGPHHSSHRSTVLLEGHAVVNRHDFGLEWSNAMIKLDDEVRLSASLELLPAGARA